MAIEIHRTEKQDSFRTNSSNVETVRNFLGQIALRNQERTSPLYV